MAINTINQILEKRGVEYLNQFLNDEVIIFEKLDTYRLMFEKKDGNICFYKKDGTPINLIERVITNIWEPAFHQIPALLEKIDIPENYRFGIAYTPIERPIRIPYAHLPKYILTDIIIQDKKTEISDYNELKEWAGKLCMGRPPIIYQGLLTEQQKNALYNYGIDKFPISITEFLRDYFENSYSKENIIEGIIIKGKDGIFQILSKEFEVLNEAYEKDFATPRDYYDIIVMSLNNFMDNYTLPNINSYNIDERYLEIINDIFNNFIERKAFEINESDIDVKFLNPPQYGFYGKLNINLINNNKTLKILQEGALYEAIYKIILSSFRKYKKAYGLLTEDIVKKFNTYVFLINNTVNSQFAQTIDEGRSDNVLVSQINATRENDIDNMRVIASIQKAFESKAFNVNKGKEKCIIYITDYLPFSNSQFENIIDMAMLWNMPIILGAISSQRKIKGDNFTISDNLLEAQMKSLCNFKSDQIVNSVLLESWDLTDIFQYCRPDYEPIVIITDTGKKSELALQLYFEEEIMGRRLNVENEFSINEMTNKDRHDLLRAIEDQNPSKFNSLTPEPIHSFYDSIISEYKTWSGMIRVQQTNI
jgi:predicted DNA-binding protein YlxM (UPF0122 family)